MIDVSQLVWLFLRLKGRISRAAYLLAGLLANLIPLFLLYRFTLVPEGSTESMGSRPLYICTSLW